MGVDKVKSWQYHEATQLAAARQTAPQVGAICDNISSCVEAGVEPSSDLSRACIALQHVETVRAIYAKQNCQLNCTECSRAQLEGPIQLQENRATPYHKIDVSGRACDVRFAWSIRTDSHIGISLQDVSCLQAKSDLRS